MHFCVKVCVSMLAIATLLGLAGTPARAQDKQHVVSLSDLNKDAALPARTRQANEEAVRTLLSSDQAQKALKSADLDYQNDLLWIIVIALGIIVLAVVLR